MRIISIFLLWALFGWIGALAQSYHAEQLHVQCDSVVPDGVKPLVVDPSVSSMSSMSTSTIDTVCDSTSNVSHGSVMQSIKVSSFQQVYDDSSDLPLSGYHHKKPLLTCVSSLLIPGLGQICNGEIAKGVTFMVTTYGMGFLALNSIRAHSIGMGTLDAGVALGIYIWNIIDAASSGNQYHYKRSIVNILFKKSALGLNPVVGSVHTQDGQNMLYTSNVGIKLSYCMYGKNSRQ